MASSGRLSGTVALITGAAHGIGRATAALFAEEGAKVGLLDKSAEDLKRLAQEIQNRGGRALAVCADVTRKPEIDAAVDAIRSSFGPVTVLVNNAGVTLTKPFTETSMDEVDFLVDVNFKSVILTSQAVIPGMIESGGGSIVHDASNAGIVGRPWQPIYGATKAGVVSLTKSMALAFAKHNIRVNCICPGSIDTPMLRGALSASGNFDENWRRTELVIPLGRIGKPADIAYATLYLASSEAAYVTGAVLPVDGGRTAGVPETFHVGLAERARE